jgi:hypothetical protein
MLHIPTAPFWWVVAVMFAISVLVQAVVTAEYVAGYEPPERHGEHG